MPTDEDDVYLAILADVQPRSRMTTQEGFKGCPRVEVQYD
jgi:hypothetical protein